MATDPKDFRDPTVTSTTKPATTESAQNPMMKWIAIAAGVIVLLLVLGWLLGLFADDDVDAVVPADETTVVPSE